MFVSAKHLLAYAILLAIGESISAEYDVAAYCKQVKPGTMLASTESCQDFYVCSDGMGIKQSCNANELFDKNSQRCRDSSAVECYFGTSQPCAKKQSGYVPNMSKCGGYIYCKNNKEMGRGTCPSDCIFLNGECRYGTCIENTDSKSAGIRSVCDIMPLNTYFGSSVSCGTWQMCTTKGLTTGECMGMTNMVYDVRNNLCNYETPGMCDRVTGDEIQPEEDAQRDCTVEQNGLTLPSNSECSAYFVCDNLKWRKYTCNGGFFFDVKRSACRQRQMATPVASCNRCEGTTRQFVNSVDSNCRSYLICNNSKKVGKGECSGNLYFNEAAQACMQESSSKTAYLIDNGACAATVDNDCDGIVDPNGDCVEISPNSPDNCDTNCGKLAVTAAKCIATGQCQCGIHEGDCVDCKGENCDGCNQDRTECLNTEVCKTIDKQCVKA